ncbi:unnamed protein product [Acanthosepion pharaonis]|uniref:Uncharacterized protein n=1 Tax=Acanthosepion pharaonis TaxID=158019 RepID=A0A812BT19_ACAPH|nr:unnamed protein product [Sepia pharaonis]
MSNFQIFARLAYHKRGKPPVRGPATVEICQTETCRTFRFSLGSRTTAKRNTRPTAATTDVTTAVRQPPVRGPATRTGESSRRDLSDGPHSDETLTRASDSRDDGRNDGHTLAKDSRPYEDQQLAPESRPDEICQTETCRTFRFSLGSRTTAKRNTRVRQPRRRT